MPRKGKTDMDDTAIEITNKGNNTVDQQSSSTKPKRKRSTKSIVTNTQDDAALDNTKKNEPTGSKKRKESITSLDKTTSNDENTATDIQKKVKTPTHQVITDRDELPKLWNEDLAKSNGSYTFKIASWNVAGIRAVLNNAPNTFVDFVKRHNIDVLCLQETKLQEQHVSDPKLNIVEKVGLQKLLYDDYWSCSTSKKGYSGTAVFIRRRNNSTESSSITNKTKGTKQTSMMQFMMKKGNDNDTSSLESPLKQSSDDSIPIDPALLIPTNISYSLGKEKHDTEGRIIVVEYPLFTLCNVYVPNAGQKLERLSYRVDEWDVDFLQFIHQKRVERKGLPVLWLGDLNVAHTNLEVWNDGAKHLPKQAGVTPEERASFQGQLDAGHIDAFRYLHPNAAGHYSYWSMRAGNRSVNKGLRLDYFIGDTDLFYESSRVTIRDSYMDYSQEGSDHCPVILEMEIKA